MEKGTSVHEMRQTVREWDPSGKWEFIVSPDDGWEEGTEFTGWVVNWEQKRLLCAGPVVNGRATDYEPGEYLEYLKWEYEEYGPDAVDDWFLGVIAWLVGREETSLAEP